MKKEEELDKEILFQINKRKDVNSALRKILENINTNYSKVNNSEQKKKNQLLTLYKEYFTKDLTIQSLKSSFKNLSNIF